MAPGSPGLKGRWPGAIFVKRQTAPENQLKIDITNTMKPSTKPNAILSELTGPDWLTFGKLLSVLKKLKPKFWRSKKASVDHDPNLKFIATPCYAFLHDGRRKEGPIIFKREPAKVPCSNLLCEQGRVRSGPGLTPEGSPINDVCPVCSGDCFVEV